MLEDFGRFLEAVVSVFKTEFTLYGFTFSFWEIFLWLAVIGIVCFILGVFFDD